MALRASLPRIFLALALVWASSTVARAVEAPVERIADSAVIQLQGEVMLLVELDAFTDPVPADLARIHRENVRFMRGVSRIGLLDWLQDKDASGARLLERLRAEGQEPSAAVAAALGALSPEDERAAQDGAPIAIAPDVYVDALYDLQLRQGAAPEGEPAAPSPTGAPDPREFADAAPARSISVTMLVGLGLVLGIAIFGVWLLVRRRSAGNSTGDERMGRLLEAGRRMTKALDPKAIAMIASEEAAVLTAASFTGAIEVTPDGLRLAHQTRADAFDERRLGEGALGRVLETGQPIRAVSHDEPALTSLPASLLAVPVISAGRVGGVLVAVRPDDMPFTAEEQDDLLRLAPMVGSAWEAASVHDGVAEQAMRDGLTGLANRRRLDRDLPDALAGGDRTIGIVMIDVDHFKTYNDTHGHAAGDEALRSVAEILSVNVRDGDVVYRYGGEEFCVLLPDTTDEEACAVAERLRAAVEAAPFAGEERQPGGKVTISVGLALTEGGDPDAALRSADGALYEAKHGGRNRVVVVLGPDGPGLLLS